MVEEAGIVVGACRGSLWIETGSRSACSACAQSGCGSSLISKMFDGKVNHFEIENSLDARVGDRVVIGIPDEALVRASFAAYLLPLCTMLIMVVLAAMAGSGSGVQILAALSGLFLGFYGLSRRLSVSMRIQPRLLRIDGRPVVWRSDEA